VEDGIIAVMGTHVWGYDDDTPEKTLSTILMDKGLTVATMESCTGGLLASTITDVPGSSMYFLGGIITYSSRTKKANGVPGDIIDRYGAISGETAEAMAKAVKSKLKADIGIGITGVAGPSEQEGKAVGTVFVSINTDQMVRTLALRLPPRREVVKTRSVTTTLVALSRLLNE